MQYAPNDHGHDQPVERYVADILETLNRMPGEVSVSMPTLPKLSELGATPATVAQVNRFLAPYRLTMAQIYSVVSKMYLRYGKLDAEQRDLREKVLARLERMLLNPDFQEDVRKLLGRGDGESQIDLNILLMGALRVISMAQGEAEIHSAFASLYLISWSALFLAVIGICLAIWLPKANK
jgi:hypothetical protein